MSEHRVLGTYASRSTPVAGGSPAAYVNAVVDAVAHLGVRNVEMPAMSSRVWEAIRQAKEQH